MEIEEYSASSEIWVFRDEADAEKSEHIDFHLQTGDYLPHISTVLGFVEETLQSSTTDATPDLIPHEVEALKAIRKDLAYLHKHYQLVPKT